VDEEAITKFQSFDGISKQNVVADLHSVLNWRMTKDLQFVNIMDYGHIQAIQIVVAMIKSLACARVELPD